MQKNNFMKSLLALMMVLAMSMSMTSCQGFVDAVFGSEDNPVEKPETTEETESSTEVKANGTTITIASGDEIEDALTEAQAKQMIEAIKASAAKNEEYTITIMSEDPLDAANFGFEVPSIAKANINLVFDCDLVTSEDSPLVIDSESKSKTSTDAINELTITLPDGADDVYLSLTTPETSVTVEGKVTIHYLEALTALSTLYVQKGVTIEELLVKGGRVLVYDGGEIETYVFPTGKEDWKGNSYINIVYDSEIAKYTGYAPLDVLISEDTDEYRPELMSCDADGNEVKPYFTKYLKIIKGEKDDAVRVNFWMNDEDGTPIEKVTICDGVTVNTDCIRAKSVIGEGKAKVTFEGEAQANKQDDGEGGYVIINELFIGGFAFVDEISNIIFTEPINHNDEITEYRTILDCVPGNIEGCTFKYNAVIFGDWDREFTVLKDGSVVKDCKFEPSSDDNNNMEIRVPYQEGSKFGFTFDGCAFAEGTLVIPNARESRKGDPIEWHWEKHNRDDWALVDAGEVDNPNKIPEETEDIVVVSGPSRYEENGVEYDAYTVTIGFEDCTLGGSAVTSKSEMFVDYGMPDGITVKYIIDGTTYVAVWYQGSVRLFVDDEE